ncbi:hypothetical protein [Chromobacterium haemolyticum]|uniref:hypothetical protein n=1 Tax=Chromobacterium haemolyticum TaxID=394935 RepID=UPI0009FBF9F1|nr:hypothetical protein [Chromobacterium haemolyticum]
MRNRKTDANGDMVFGLGQASFYKDQPEAVGQAIWTRLQLPLGDFFVDTSDGTAWRASVLGNNTQYVRDAVIKQRILGTPGVNQILEYISSVDPNTRAFTVSATVETIYGSTTISGVIQ